MFVEQRTKAAKLVLKMYIADCYFRDLRDKMYEKKNLKKMVYNKMKTGAMNPLLKDEVLEKAFAKRDTTLVDYRSLSAQVIVFVAVSVRSCHRFSSEGHTSHHFPETAPLW